MCLKRCVVCEKMMCLRSCGGLCRIVRVGTESDIVGILSTVLQQVGDSPSLQPVPQWILACLVRPDTYI